MNLTKEDIDALEDAAKKATPGPWCVQHPNAGVRGFEVADRTGLEQICADLTEPLARYIAAANPAVVLALINKVRIGSTCPSMELLDEAIDERMNDLNLTNL